MENFDQQQPGQDTGRPVVPTPGEDRLAGHDGQQEVTLHAERLDARTEQHEWSRVRITRRVVTEERTITVPVRREELVIEYPEGVAPQGHPGTVRGSTETVASEVRQEFVLHEEVPVVTVEARPYEKVQVVVDTQQSLVEHTDQVRREELHVEQHDPVTGESWTSHQVGAPDEHR